MLWLLLILPGTTKMDSIVYIGLQVLAKAVRDTSMMMDSRGMAQSAVSQSSSSGLHPVQSLVSLGRFDTPCTPYLLVDMSWLGGAERGLTVQGQDNTAITPRLDEGDWMRASPYIVSRGKKKRTAPGGAWLRDLTRFDTAASPR